MFSPNFRYLITLKSKAGKGFCWADCIQIGSLILKNKICMTTVHRSKNIMLCLFTRLCLTLCNPVNCSPPGSSAHGVSPGKNTGVGCHALLEGIFPTRGSNSGLQHYRQILSHLSHQVSPRILKWIAYSFSRGSSQRRNRTGVS